MRNGKTAALCLLAGGLWMAAPAGADWLVTRDGGKVETRGPWKVDGKRVVFTLTDGTLSSLRLTEVDLDASRQATTAAEQSKEAQAAKPAATPRKSVRVLTDKDFPRPEPTPVVGAAEGAAAGTGGPGGEKAAAAPASNNTAVNNAVQVQGWKQNRNQELDQMEITGSVQNTGPDLASAVSVIIRLFDARGEVLATQRASLTTRTLRPGQNTTFKAVFPKITGFESAKLEVSSLPLLLRQPGAETGQPAEGEEKPPSR